MILDSLLKTNTASGWTEKVCEIIRNQLENTADDIYTDNLGNLIVRIGDESKPSVALFAPCDAPSFIVTHIEENGYVRIHPIGNIDFRSTLYCHVTNGKVNGVLYPDSSNADNFSLVHVNFGFNNLKDAELHINKGDVLFFKNISLELENCVMCGTGISSLACADACFMTAINVSKDTDKCFYFVFLSQDNLQHRSASVAGFNIKPDVAVCLEPYEGKELCVKIADKSFVSDTKITQNLVKIAENNEIKLQKYVCAGEHGYACRVQSAGAGIKTVSLLLPVKHFNTTSETINRTDVEKISLITTQFLNNI